MTKWTDQQYLDALKRVQQQAGSCRVEDYKAHRREDDPTVQAVITRFHSFNRAKIACGLPITIKRRRTIRRKPDLLETDLPPRRGTRRRCLRCDEHFLSYDLTHRICDPCKLMKAWHDGLEWI